MSVAFAFEWYRHKKGGNVMVNDISIYKEALKKAVSKINELDEEVKSLKKHDEIAVIGYDCKFPGGANSPEQFWQLLTEEFDAVTEIKNERFNFNDYYSDNKEEQGKMFTKYASFLDTDIKSFDNIHFELSAVEAKSVDPQQRLLLEVSWNALEHAGIDVKDLRGSKTGVFIGLDSNEYFKAEVLSGDESDITPYSLMGVSQHSAAGRISYFYDLKGPSIMCNTACSSSLTALGLAVQSLREKQSDLAIVGGVNLLLTPSSFVGLSQFQALSSDGKCKTFDKSADGFGCGEGCGVVILKRISDAQRDGNSIEALIKGISMGQDGRTNGFFAPNGIAEKMVIQQAIKDSGCNINGIDYIEAHGTGTILGDTIEAQAVSDVFCKKKEPVYIGAVKSNIGHLEAAAGMASLIKVILSMKHKQIPASIHCENPNPNIDWSHLKVVTKLMNWEKNEDKRRAGISAFGISGSLAHVIVEEAPEKKDVNVCDMPYHLLTLSTKNKNVLKDSVKDILDEVTKKDIPISAIAYTSNITRSKNQYRFACVAKDKEDLKRELENALNKDKVFEYNSSRVDGRRRVAFLFTGQGSIYKGMAKQLYNNSNVFKAAMDKCDKSFQQLLKISIKENIFRKEKDELQRPVISQPVIFSIEYSLAEFWKSAGVKPDVVIGHSIGEYVAACYAGIMEFSEAVKLIAIRGKIMETCELDGKMVGVLTDYESVSEAIKESGCLNVSIAAVNAPANTTISGLREEVDKVIETLQNKQRVFIDDLKILHPYHSKLMEQYKKEYLNQMGDIIFTEPKLPIISCVFGKLDKNNEIGTKVYWAEHLAKTVHFQSAMKEAEAFGTEIFLEIGGNATLCGLGSQCLVKDEIQFIPSLRNEKEDYKQVLKALKSLYLAGYPIDWRKFYQPYKKERVELPSYHFYHKEFWKNPNKHSISEQEENKIERKKDMEEKKVGDSVLSRVDTEIKELISMIAGIEADEIETDKELFSLGFDSLLMMTLGKQISKKYHVEIPINEFFTSVNTLQKIEEYIVKNGDIEQLVELETSKMPATPEVEVHAESISVANPKEGKNVMEGATGRNKDSLDISFFQNVFDNQFTIMSEQNDIIRSLFENGSRSSQNCFYNQLKLQQNVETVKKAQKQVQKEIKKENYQEADYYIPYHKLELTKESELEDLQLHYLKQIEKKYTSLTKSSKQNIQNYRKVYANARNSAGFRPIFKEMLYQVIAERGSGSKFIDLDGNEFIDVTMGFGVNLFGHAPKFVRDALKDEINHGMPLGPMGRLPGEVARKISELTGVERVFFCNSGTEADMFAIRLARAVTGKNKIVAFTGAYHGTYDGLLALPAYQEDGTIYSIPQAPGITEQAVSDLILLSYNSENSLKYIQEHSNEIAGVIVETVQSRRPDIQPKKFLQKLRKLTEDGDMALIFDEVITGFRISAGGAQEFFGIEADIVTYGKVVGGGMPIGVVSGKSRFMDSVDGGMWSFGDDSIPPYEEKRTYVAGTFCHHPMAMAAANAVLDYILEHKDSMYKNLNHKADVFADKLNTFFQAENVPFTVIHFGSLFRFTVAREYEVFYYGLLEKGIYIWEGRNCFLSTAHSDEDIEKIINSVELTVKEMKDAGYFGKSPEPDPERRKDEQKSTCNFSVSDGKLPMSMIQERLFSQIMISESDPFDIVAAFTVKKPIDIGRLEQAVNRIIERHEILRTSMFLEDGSFYQEVMGNWNFHIREMEQKEEGDLNNFISNAISKFDLLTPPLIEVLLIDTAQKEKIIVFHFHHTAADGISMNIFVRELTAIYNNIKLEPLKVQYRDFVKWENEYMNSEVEKADKKYWLNRLSDVPCTVPLLYDYPNTGNAGYAGDSLLEKMDVKTLSALKKIAKNNGASVFMILLAIINILMHKMTREKEIALLTPVTNRFDGGFEECIGMFTNTIVLSSKIEDDVPFDTYLKKIKKECIESYSHISYPYNRLIDELNVTGKKSFNIMFVYENTDSRTMDQISDLELDEFPYTPTTQEFDITFELLEKNGNLDMYLRYRTDLFSKQNMNVMMEHLLYVISQVVENPTILYSDISIATEEEKEKILYKFNKGIIEYPSDKTVVDFFESQAAKTPNATAVIFEDRKINYDELNKRANHLAYKLRTAGVKSDTFVAILAQRSIEMIVSILGILKAGGAYVPIDPTYPEDRIIYILNDCKPKAVIVYQMENVKEFCGDILIIDMKKESEEKMDDNLINPPHVNSVHDIAYVIYTSGTTGRPKGVMVEHLNLVRLLFNDAPLYDFSENDVWTMFHSYCFDFSVWEIFGSLLYGGSLVVLSADMVKDSKKVCNVIEKHKVTVLNQVPTAFYSLMVADNENQMKSVRYLIFGGEALNPARLKDWYNKYPNVSIVNMYGITETTVHVTYRRIGEEEIERGISDIGQAIPTLSVYIMDKENLCGIGVAGELCVAGAGVARGYLNQPELQNEKFVRNPFGEGMLYRSGDLARWLPDGNLEYLGRIDEQVKIRGFRIELKEIENVIRNISYVKGAVVIAKKDILGENAICAYVVSDIEINVEKLKDLIGKSLPQYMIPAYIMQINAIPLTRNGKLNQKELPEVTTKSDTQFVPPSDEWEQILCKIFEEILGVEQVGVRDDFFALGGHSLRATRLINMIEAKTGIKLAVKTIFQAHTVEKLGMVLKQKEGEKETHIPLAVRQDSYPMSSSQKRIFLIWKMDPENLAYNMSCCYQFNGNVDMEKARKTLQKIVARHEILRTDFHMEKEELIQTIHESVSVELDYLEDEQVSVEHLMKKFVRPFNLTQAPLIRAKIVKKADISYLMIDTHHIIGDGMSLYIIIKEFMSLYNGEMAETLYRQYKDYSEWMRIRDLSKQKAYWQQEFSDDIPVLDLPYDYQRPQKRNFQGSVVSMGIKKKLYEKLKELTRQTDTTEYMLFLASAMILLGKYSRQEDIVIGSPISGRTHKDLENMLGMFVNTLAMRGKPRAGKTFKCFLEEIRDTCLLAYEHQEYPFEELVEDANVQRDMSRNPIFDVMLVLQNNETADFTLDGVTANMLETKTNVAKFDLTFNIYEVKEGYKIELEYDTLLFKKESVEQILEHYVLILEQIVSNPNVMIEKLQMISAQEKKLILHQFNNTATDYPKDKTVADLLEDQARKTPDKVAITFENKEITYQELNERANQVALKLKTYQIQSGDFVAVMAERSIEMIVGICGIVKAGGAYIPIDPTYPEERILYMLEDCRAKVLLTYQVKANIKVSVIDLENILDEERREENPERKMSAEDICYCIYTSGTTGKPKGTMIPNKAVVRLVKNTNYITLTEKDAILQTGSISFDAATFEIWGSLLNGGKLVLLPSDDIMDCRKLKEHLVKEKVTVMFMTTSLFNQMIQTDNTIFNSLKVLMTGGEKISLQHVKMLKDVNRSSKLLHCYGPTENTTFTTTYEIPTGYEMLPIGKPISNTTVYIMNQGNLCGIGVPGELCIGGEGLFKGYLNNEEYTREKCEKNPFGEGYLYHSGDLARWMPDGNIDFLGRIDEQVKIRGFRVELAEIEKTILGLDEIRAVAVIAKEEPNKTKAIHAYVVSDNKIDCKKIKEHLLKTLPDYMIPTYWMQIESIPITQNGKLDKKALPVIETESHEDFEEAITDIEKILCHILEEVLGAKKVGRKDNFFELGGDSIKAIRVVSKMRDAGYEIAYKDIMQLRVVEEIAYAVSQNKDVQYEQGAVEGTVIQTPILKDFKEWNLSKPQHFNQAVMIKIPNIEEDLVINTLDAIWEHHDILRAVYRNSTLKILKPSENRKYDFAKYDYQLVDNRKLKELIESECNKQQESFDLVNGPLMKAAMFLTKKENYMFFCLHHLIVDGVSWRIFLEDFNTALKQLQRNEKIQLPRKTASYLEWSHALEEYRNSKELQSEFIYWRDVSENMKNGAFEIGEGCVEVGYETIKFELSKELSQKLVKEAGKAFHTEIIDLLLGAVARTVAQITGQDKVTISMEGHGREEIHKKIDIDRTIGWFTSVFPVIVDCKEDIRETIIGTKEMLRKIPNHGMGYGLLKDRLISPKVDIYLNYLGEMDTEFKGQNEETFDTGKSIADENSWQGDINLDGIMLDQKLGFTLTYNRRRYNDMVMKKFADNYKCCLEELILFCLNQEEDVKTASDFGASNLESTELLEIMNLF